MSSGKYLYKHGKRRIFEQEWEYLYENTVFLLIYKSEQIDMNRG